MSKDALVSRSSVMDVVLDTDAYNEIDDQYAIAYLLCLGERVRVKAFHAAPFYNEKSASPQDGMNKSYDEILHILFLMGRDDLKNRVFKGSCAYMKSEQEPVLSPAQENLVRLAREHTPEEPLYVVAIGAITNVASALVAAPDITDKISLIWLGGHAFEWGDTAEFNLRQDIAAARVIFGSGVPLVQLPCMGVVEMTRTTKPELEFWLKGKNPLCDYLVRHTVEEAESYAAGSAWSRVIWDITAVAWLTDDQGVMFKDRVVPRPQVTADCKYDFSALGALERYIYHVDRDRLFTQLFTCLGNL